MRFILLASVVIALVVLACGGGSVEVMPAATATSLVTETPVEQSSASITIAGRDQLSIGEYFQRVTELDAHTSMTTAALRDRVANGLLELENAIVADFANIGEFVIGLYALEPPNELFTNHERRVQSLMAYVVAFQDRKHLLEEASEHDADVCEETERLAVNHGITVNLECKLGDW